MEHVRRDKEDLRLLRKKPEKVRRKFKTGEYFIFATAGTLPHESLVNDKTHTYPLYNIMIGDKFAIINEPLNFLIQIIAVYKIKIDKNVDVDYTTWKMSKTLAQNSMHKFTTALL